MTDKSTTTARIMNNMQSSFSPSSQRILQQGLQPGGQTQATTPIVSSAVAQQASDLDLLDQAMQEAVAQPAASSQFSAAAPQMGQVQNQPTVQTQAPPPLDTLNPTVPTVGAKEAIESAVSPDSIPPESGAAISYVEQEKSPEIDPEVSEFLQRVEQAPDQAPQEIVVADDKQTVSMVSKQPAKPVVVLPITPEVEKAGKKKNPKFSIRWLVEWSRKIMKMFKGMVIYRKK